MTQATKSVVINLPKINIQQLQITLIGESSLISHAWSKKAKQEMLDKQMKKAKGAKAAKNPFMDYCESMYWIDGMPEKPTEELVAAARFGFPSVAFKASAIGACRFADGMKMTEARGSFHIDGELVQIIGRPQMREDMVRIAMGTADIRFRGEFPEWAVVLNIKHNLNAMSAEQIVNLFSIAGFGQGIGEWRPERDGPYGRFRIGNLEEAEDLATRLGFGDLEAV